MEAMNLVLKDFRLFLNFYVFFLHMNKAVYRMVSFALLIKTNTGKVS